MMDVILSGVNRIANAIRFTQSKDPLVLLVALASAGNFYHAAGKIRTGKDASFTRDLFHRNPELSEVRTFRICGTSRGRHSGRICRKWGFSSTFQGGNHELRGLEP